MSKNTKNVGPAGYRWDRMSKAERLALIRTDATMRHPHWTALADRWASADWGQLTGLQREATMDLFKSQGLSHL